MTIIERQHLSITDVRSMCIAEDLYTCGTNKEYEAMFYMVNALYPKSILTGEDLYPIAADILAHSNTDMEVADIMFLLAEKITRCFEVTE